MASKRPVAKNRSDRKDVGDGISSGNGITIADRGRLRLAQMALEARQNANQMMVNAQILENVILKGKDEEVLRAVAALDENEMKEREEMN